MSINKKDEFVFVAGGDSMITRPLLPYLGVSERFDQLIRILREADTTVINLESVIHNYENPAAGVGGTAMRTPPEVVDDIAEMGCDMLVTGNNHVFDYGIPGLKSTMKALHSGGIPFAGMGMNLFEARQPAYTETAAGRVALLSTTTKITKGSEAGKQSQALPGRSGVSPLRTTMVQTLLESDLQDLERISERLGWEGIKQAWIDRGFYGGRNWNDPDYFHFGDLKFKETDDLDEVGITYEVSDSDRNEVCDWITEARRSADWVITSIHSHDGPDGPHKRLDVDTPRPDEPTNNEKTPAFLEETARQFIDAGADVVIGTGPHVLRGVEIYDSKPIFYSLGNFIMQRPSVTRFPPHMYQRYGLEDYTKPSAIFDQRFLNQEDQPRGDLANPYMWETVIPVCTFNSADGLTRCELYPITLQRMADRSQRGIPVLASGNQAELILERIASLSKSFGTTIKIENEVGIIALESAKNIDN